MRIFVLCLLTLTTMRLLASVNEDAYLALRNGAIGKYTYRVVDDEGSAVANVQAHVWFKSYGRPQDKADWIVETDTNGMFTVEHRFNEKFSVWFYKEGYYRSDDEINYLVMEQLPVKNGQWQPFGRVKNIVLKPIKAPVDVGSFGRCSRLIPVYDEWIGFDLECQEWMPPFGNGKCPDVLLRFGKSLVHRQTDYKMTMEVCFTNNPYAGFYKMKEDAWSERKTVYHADMGAVFLPTEMYIQERHPNVAKVDTRLDNDSYLVFRTRTRIDAEGNLVSAHYGIIRGRWSFFETMLCGGCLFNPTPNDTNLEDLETARLSQLRREQELDREMRNK